MAEKKNLKTQLIPYSSEIATDGLALRVEVGFEDMTLSLDFELSGKVDEILIPGLDSPPQRLDRLWERTCFEAFFTKGRDRNENPAYWELNVAPSGHWNLYHFDEYRVGQKQELQFSFVGYQVLASDSRVFKVRILLDLSPLFQGHLSLPLFLSATAVIEKKDRLKTYWAMRHVGKQPDFHLRDSFVTRIESGRIEKL